MSEQYEQKDLFTRKRRPILCRCKCCHHGLSDPESVARGIGPECYAQGGGERWQIMLGLEEPQR
jgi:hypothetical protein